MLIQQCYEESVTATTEIASLIEQTPDLQTILRTYKVLPLTLQHSRVYQFGERQAHYLGVSLDSVDEFVSTLEIDQLKSQAASLIRSIGLADLTPQASTSPPSSEPPSKSLRTLEISWSRPLCCSR